MGKGTPIGVPEPEEVEEKHPSPRVKSVLQEQRDAADHKAQGLLPSMHTCSLGFV